MHFTDDSGTDEHHRGVHDTGVTTSDLNFTLAGDMGHLHHHLAAGDPHLVEGCPAIVLVVEGELGAEVTSLNTGQVLEGVSVSELDNEGVHTVVLLPDQETSHHDRVSRVAAHLAWPILCGSDSG